MKDDVNLRIPGPTPCPREVREALSRPMSNHRGAEMKVLVSGLYEKLSRYLETSHEIFLLTASGTGGLEAAVANLLSPGERWNRGGSSSREAPPPEEASPLPSAPRRH